MYLGAILGRLREGLLLGLRGERDRFLGGGEYLSLYLSLRSSLRISRSLSLLVGGGGGGLCLLGTGHILDPTEVKNF